MLPPIRANIECPPLRRATGIDADPDRISMLIISERQSNKLGALDVREGCRLNTEAEL